MCHRTLGQSRPSFGGQFSAYRHWPNRVQILLHLRRNLGDAILLQVQQDLEPTKTTSQNGPRLNLVAGATRIGRGGSGAGQRTMGRGSAEPFASRRIDTSPVHTRTAPERPPIVGKSSGPASFPVWWPADAILLQVRQNLGGARCRFYPRERYDFWKRTLVRVRFGGIGTRCRPKVRWARLDPERPVFGGTSGASAKFLLQVQQNYVGSDGDAMRAPRPNSCCTCNKKWADRRMVGGAQITGEIYP